MSKNARDDLRVPIKFDATRTGVGERRARRMAANLRAMHNSVRAFQFNQTINLLRYQAVDSGKKRRGVAPTFRRVDVQLFNNLPAEIGNFRQDEEIVDGQKFRRVNVRNFILYNVPEYKAENGRVVAQVLQTDQIEYLGDVYDVVTVNFQPFSGRNFVTARLRVA